MKTKKAVLGAHFLYNSGSIKPIVFKNNRVHLWVNTHQPCEFHGNWFKIAT